MSVDEQERSLEEILKTTTSDNAEEDLTEGEESLAEGNDFREAIFNNLGAVDAQTLDDIDEPVVHIKTTLAFTNALDNRDILAGIEISYLPDDLYLQEHTLADYFQEFYLLEFLPQSALKLAFADLVRLLNPRTLDMVMEYVTDRGVTVTIELNNLDSDDPVDPPVEDDEGEDDDDDDDVDPMNIGDLRE